jgi:hypothetical protein
MNTDTDMVRDMDRDTDRDMDRDTERDTRTGTRTGTRNGTWTGILTETGEGTRTGTWAGKRTQAGTQRGSDIVGGLQDIKSVQRLFSFKIVYLSDEVTLSLLNVNLHGCRAGRNGSFLKMKSW